MWRVGIIGCGRVGCEFKDCHARAYLDCTKTNLESVCDIDINKAYACSHKLGGVGTITDDYEEMFLAIRLDIISVCTPPETHCQIVCDIAPYVKAIYCEKPIATTIEDAEKMIEVCHKHNVILQVNHQRRFGRPKFLFSRGLLNTGSHMFDLLRMYFGNIKIGEGNTAITPNGLVIDIVELGGEAPIFRFEMPESNYTVSLIKNGVEHLVECLETGKQSISSGEEALEALRLVERFKELSSSNNR